jgi:hypothetical protein
VTFEEFLQQEEANEKLRAEQRREKEMRREAEEKQRKAESERVSNSKKSYDEKKAAQKALKDRIMSDAQRRWEESLKKKYDLNQPPSQPEPWLVFDRVTGELYGEATKLRAYQAWAEVNPMKLVHEPGAKEPYLIAVGYNACRCVLKSEWEKAEAEFRKKKMNGKSRT